MRGVKPLCLALAAVMLIVLASADADGRRRKKRRRKRKAVATKRTKAGIKKLMGKYRWGMSARKVLKMIQAETRKEYRAKIRRQKDLLKQDRLRREMRAELKKIRKNYVKFIGKKTPWDVSLVDREFGHKNNEAMMVNWGDRDRRFYFFHHARLWKVFIAFNATLYRGKTFNDFAAAMERVFGRAERKFKTNLKGEAEMSHLEWPAARKTKLIAIDQTAFYGNFCLVLTHLPAAKRVKAGRKVNSPKKNYRDPLVRAVTSKNRPGSTTDPNADIVDQLTGRGVKAPKRSDTPSRTTAPTPRKKKKKKKISTKDPLKDLDI